MANQHSQSTWQYPYDTYVSVYLENTKAGHRKFYQMISDGKGSWTATWGKIGTNGQSMVYNRRDWMVKLDEKVKKGYIITDAVSKGTASKGKGTPPPLVKPRKPDPEIITDAEIVAKIDRIILFLDEKKNERDEFLAESIKIQYMKTGVLTKGEMDELNKLWHKNGGGRW